MSRVRRRLYVALVTAGATFLVGLLYWPLRTHQERVIAEISLELASPSVGAVLGQDIPAREARLERLLRDCLADEVLHEIAARSRGNGLPQPSGAAALWDVPDIRPHLHVGLTRASVSDAPQRWIQVIWAGPTSPLAPRFVDLLTQEIASRVAREIRVEAIQLKLEERFDQIAGQNQQDNDRLGRILREAEQQLEQQQLVLLAWRQQRDIAPFGSEPSETARREMLAWKDRVLQADASLLTLLRQQVIHHFEVDETDGLVQHLESLIRDRQNLLNPSTGPTPTPRIEGLSGRSVPTRMATHVTSSQVASAPGSGDASGLVDEDRRVKANPFFAASTVTSGSPATPTPPELDIAAEILDEVQLETLANQLRQAVQIIRQRDQQPLAAVNWGTQLQQSPALYRVVAVKAAQRQAPGDVAPSRQWAFGLALVSLMLGTAFTLQHSPESLVQAVFRPGQLARYLGIDHLGTIPTARPQPNWLDQGIRLLGRRLFQSAEVVVLLSLGAVIIAMIWDPALTESIVTDPLGGVCRAFWTLMRT